MKHKVVVEVTLEIDAVDQAYASTEAEHKIFAALDCKRVRVVQSQKQSTGNEDGNYGVTGVEKPVIKLPERPRRDPGISLSVVGAGKS